MNFRRDSLHAGSILLFVLFFSTVFGQGKGSGDAAGAEQSNLSPARIRQALLAERASIARDPTNPAPYIDLAYTLTDAGVGDEARRAAIKATQVAPGSALAFNAQGWVFHHNLIGVDYGKGFDYEGALASYRKGIALDPTDLSLRQSLAELLEYNKNGIHYAPDAHLGESIEIYRFIRSHQTQVVAETEDNFLIDSFYAGMYREVLSEIAKIPVSTVRSGVAIASLAAVGGTAAALDYANHLGGDERKKKEALSFAAEGLWNMRLYPQAADVLTASLGDASSDGDLVGKIQIFHHLRAYDGSRFPATDPRSPVQRMIYAAILNSSTPEVVADCISRNSFSMDAEWKRGLAKTDFITGMLRTISRGTGLPPVVIEDIVFGSISITVVPSEAPGTRVLVRIAGSVPHSFFVLQEAGQYKIVATERSYREIGTQALYLLHHGQMKEAEALLDWKRSLVEKDGGDDPLGGSIFARYWSAGMSRGAEAIELASASLGSDSEGLSKLLSSAVAARKRAKTETERDDLDLILISIYLGRSNGVDAEAIAGQLLRRHPGSEMAVTLLGRAYGQQRKWADWRSLVTNAVLKHPNERGLLLLQSAAEAEAEGDFRRARVDYRRILESGRASAEDNNMFAWLSLFEDAVDDQAIASAQQANLLSRDGNAAYLHTLACLDAAKGRTAEARELLLRAMAAGGLEEPDRSAWYGLGRIFEQYGALDAAVDAYKRVDRPASAVDPVDTFVLAQARLALLRAK